MKNKEKDYYNKTKNWNFDEFNIKSENFTNWDMYEFLKSVTNESSKVLDLGTGGGEKLLSKFPEVKEILGTDYSTEMIKTANKNLLLSGRKNIKFKVMDNLKMDVSHDYFDVVVARNTVTDPKQIYKALKKNGYVIIRGVDKFDAYELKLIFGKGQGLSVNKPISIIDYENVLKAGFKDVILVPIHVVEYFENKDIFYKFLCKVPIIDDFDEGNITMTKLDKEKLDYYIERNQTSKGIRLVRRYYGITGRK